MKRINYRKIWEEHNQQKIPNGYHIHHIDGNRDNNDPLNLECLSAKEHWQRHYEQGDIIAINGKFIQGASEAGKRGGRAGKGKSKDYSNSTQSQSIKESYIKRGGSPLKGISRSDEFKKKISDGTKGENNPMYGKKHTDESIKRMKENRASIEGEKNPMYGKKHTDETKQKISNKARGRKSKMKGRINETTRSMKYKWYNNGILSIFVPEGTQPENYKLGRIKTWKN